MTSHGFVLSVDAICGAGKSTLCNFINAHFGAGAADQTSHERRRRLVELLTTGAISERALGASDSTLVSSDACAAVLPDANTPAGAIANMLIEGRVQCIVESPNKYLLELFYGQPDDYAWYLQNVTQKSCAEVHLAAHMESRANDRLVLIDRSAIGNAAFAHLNHAINPARITALNIQHFDDFTQTCILDKFPSDLFVLLSMPIETCERRLKRRREITRESIPDRAYLEQLERHHDALMAYGADDAFPYAPEHVQRKLNIEGDPQESVSALCRRVLLGVFERVNCA